MSLHVHSLAISAISSFKPALLAIRRHDRNLASQLRNALTSVALNIGEAEYSDPGTMRTRLHSAAGSANEVRSSIAVAIAWGYVKNHEVAEGLDFINRTLAMLFRLIHGRS